MQTLQLHNMGWQLFVFDGYDAYPPIKDNTHKSWQKNIHYPVDHFTGNTEFKGKQEKFLWDIKNNQLY